MKNKKEYSEAVRIFIAGSNVQAEMILETLRAEEISACKVDLGSAGVMNVYGGNSRAGEEIYVGEHDVERALEILETIGLKTCK